MTPRFGIDTAILVEAADRQAGVGEVYASLREALFKSLAEQGAQILPPTP